MAQNLVLQAIIQFKDEATKTMKRVSGEVEKMEKKFKKTQESIGEFGKIMAVVGGAGVLVIKSFVD